MKRILVPTDGSPESERAVPIAQQIAAAQGAEILLVRVIQPVIWELQGVEAPADPEVYETLLRSIEEQARAELEELRSRLESRSMNTRALALRGFAASALLDCEQEERPDLLVMATHGRTGLARFALGSVADRLVREGTVPVLLVRRSTPTTAVLKRAVVMLDGSERAERALPLVEELAGKPLEAITLFQAVPRPEDRKAAEEYLAHVADRLSCPGAAIKTLVEVGDPRRAGERIARDHDLVVLATHGRGGFDRLRHGSVAEAIVREVDTPTLLVRAME